MLFLAKIIILAKRFLVFVFINFIYRPTRLIGRLIFHKIVVRIYAWYLLIIKKIGWNITKGSVFGFLVKQRFSQSVIIFLILFIIFLNLISQSNAAFSEVDVSKTIISHVITNEFSDSDSNVIIEEDFEGNMGTKPKAITKRNDYLSGDLKISYEDELAEELNNIARSGTAVTKQDIATTAKIKRQRTGIIYYTVQAGDTISTIAEDFEISVNSILWENNLDARSMLKPGQELAILPVSGVSYIIKKGDNLGKISGLFGIDGEIILAGNNLLNANQLRIGEKIIIPGGKKTAYAVVSKPRYTGISAVRDLIKSPDSTPVSGNKMNWPTVGYRITQYFSWRHIGLDIANKIGTPLYAADSGTIEYAAWRKGYGNFVIINHGGGKVTRYGHLSKFYVSKGDEVKKGQAIGAMGSTGNSTGPHLHFEVIINGKKYNPLNYIR